MIFLQAAVDELHFNLIDVAVSGTQPLGAQSAATEACVFKKTKARLVVGGNGTMKLMKVQKIEAVADNQLQTLGGESAAAVLFAHNHNPHRRPLVVGVEIEQIDSANRLIIRTLSADNQPQLLRGVNVGLSVGNVLLERKPRIGRRGASVAPDAGVVLASVQKVEVVRFDGPKQYVAALEHRPT